jgi:hypothetical protein
MSFAHAAISFAALVVILLPLLAVYVAVRWSLGGKIAVQLQRVFTSRFGRSSKRWLGRAFTNRLGPKSWMTMVAIAAAIGFSSAASRDWLGVTGALALGAVSLLDLAKPEKSGPVEDRPRRNGSANMIGTAIEQIQFGSGHDSPPVPRIGHYGRSVDGC